MSLKIEFCKTRAAACLELFDALDALKTAVAKLERAGTSHRLLEGHVDNSRVMHIAEWARTEQRLNYEDWEYEEKKL
jgi:hypothetical protein